MTRLPIPLTWERLGDLNPLIPPFRWTALLYCE